MSDYIYIWVTNNFTQQKKDVQKKRPFEENRCISIGVLYIKYEKNFLKIIAIFYNKVKEGDKQI